jgi:hypothetical protein
MMVTNAFAGQARMMDQEVRKSAWIMLRQLVPQPGNTPFNRMREWSCTKKGVTLCMQSLSH